MQSLRYGAQNELSKIRYCNAIVLGQTVHQAISGKRKRKHHISSERRIRKLEKVWLSEIPCSKGFPANFDGRAFGNAAGFSRPRPPQPSRVLLKEGATSGNGRSLLKHSHQDDAEALRIVFSLEGPGSFPLEGPGSHLASGWKSPKDEEKFDTEYDRVKVPPHNGNDPRPPLVV